MSTSRNVPLLTGSLQPQIWIISAAAASLESGVHGVRRIRLLELRKCQARPNGIQHQVRIVTICSFLQLLADMLAVAGWQRRDAFPANHFPINRLNAARGVTIRLLICQACNKLTANQPASHRTGFHPVEAVHRQLEMMKPANFGTPILREMLDICDTEGNDQNGGGSFTVENHGDAGTFVKYESGRNASMSVGRGAPGDIGSPVPGSSFAGFGGQQRPFQHHQPGGMHPPSGF